VRFLYRLLGPESIRRCLWAAGLAALLFAAVAWVGPAQPYQAPWAWISFIAMCIVDDLLFGSRAEAPWGELPKIALLAAVIMFRRHPEITVLVAATGAPLSSLLKGQTWQTQLTATAQWVLAAVIGSAAFRLVGFEDPTHFMLATGALMIVYYCLGPLFSALLESRLTGTSFQAALAPWRWLAILLQLAGVLLALAWRTPALELGAVRLADAALVADAGIAIGFVSGGTVGRLRERIKRGPSIPARYLLCGIGFLVGGNFLPNPFSWGLPMLLGLTVGVWAVRHRFFALSLGVVGALSNELVRGLNDGRMPVEGGDILPSASQVYVAATPQTVLPWLDDRFHLMPPFPGTASLGDIALAAAVVWLVAGLMAGPRQGTQPATAADTVAA
jgi:hypothetical protein